MMMMLCRTVLDVPELSMAFVTVSPLSLSANAACH